MVHVMHPTGLLGMMNDESFASPLCPRSQAQPGNACLKALPFIRPVNGAWNAPCRAQQPDSLTFHALRLCLLLDQSMVHEMHPAGLNSLTA